MGKLIYSRLARLMMSAAMLNVAWSGIWGFPYPASLMDGTTDSYEPMHILVAPAPILQIINTVLGAFGCMNEFSKSWNRFISSHHGRFLQNIPLRCVYNLMLTAFAVLQFQASQATPYLLIGTAVYMAGFAQGERLDESGTGQRKRGGTSPAIP